MWMFLGGWSFQDVPLQKASKVDGAIRGGAWSLQSTVDVGLSRVEKVQHVSTHFAVF